MNTLSKKEAFQMILDKIFSDEEINGEFIEDTFNKIAEKPKYGGIINQLENKFKEDKRETKLENNNDEEKNNSSELKPIRKRHYNHTKFGVKNVKYYYSQEKFMYETSKGTPNIWASTFKELESAVKKAGYPWIVDDENTLKRSRKGIIPPKHYRGKDNDSHIPTKSYDKYPDIKLNDDSTFSFKNSGGRKGRKRFENYILLKIFNMAKYPMTRGEYLSISNKLSSIDMGITLRLSLLNGFYKELCKDGGKYCDVVFEIFNNDYSVPSFIDFSYDNDQLLINDNATGISRKQLKEYVGKLNHAYNPQFEIVKIMHDNHNINKRYLFWTLMNYDNQDIIEIIAEV